MRLHVVYAVAVGGVVSCEMACENLGKQELVAKNG
jgi:hypothetical protein